MRRLSAITAALACALALPAASHAAPRGLRRAHAAATALHPATGTVVSDGSYELTIQTNGRWMGRINAMTATASRITRADYSYVWGGGHAEAGIASLGSRGPGYTGRTSGFDCSGSVAAVLAGAGLWPAGGGVPNDAGIISQLLAEHVIARGAGTGPHEVTLYDDPGVHIFMNIDGRFFGTSDGAGGGSRKGGPGWLDDGAWDAFSRVFRQYHILPWVLHDRTSYGHDLTFQTAAAPGLTAAVQAGDRIHVEYSDAAAGRMMLADLSWIGARTAAGTVTAVTGDSLVVAPSAGQPLTLSIPPAAASELSGVTVGDTVTVVYTSRLGVGLARSVTVTAQPVPPPLPPPPTTPADPSQSATAPAQTTTDPVQTPPTPTTTGPAPTTTAPAQAGASGGSGTGGGSSGY